MKKHPGKWLAALGFAVGIASSLLALPAHAQLVAGRDYTRIEPAQTTDTPDKIEVIEFFSYACPHCNELNPKIQPWAKSLPPDVVFKRVPVGFNPFYSLMARLYYALEITGDLDRLDSALFSAIHEKGLRLVSDKAITEWAVSQGVDARKFSEAWNSFSVTSKTKRADQMVNNYRIQGVPAVTVDGRYLVGGRTLDEMLQLSSKVIDLRRGERAGKPTAAAKAPAAAAAARK